MRTQNSNKALYIVFEFIKKSYIFSWVPALWTQMLLSDIDVQTFFNSLFPGFILKFLGEADGFNLKKSYIQLGKILHDPPYLIQNSSDLGHFEIKIPFLVYFYNYY